MGSVNSGVSAVVASEGASARADATVGLLRTALDSSEQMMAQLMAALEAANPPGVGSSINTYG